MASSSRVRVRLRNRLGILGIASLAAVAIYLYGTVGGLELQSRMKQGFEVGLAPLKSSMAGIGGSLGGKAGAAGHGGDPGLEDEIQEPQDRHDTRPKADKPPVDSDTPSDAQTDSIPPHAQSKTFSLPGAVPPSYIGQHAFTTIPNSAHVFGYTVLDNLYLRNGTFYVLASVAEEPPRRQLLSIPVELNAENKETDPRDTELQYLAPEDAEKVLGDTRAMRIPGTSAVVYDPAQFMTHYYHWFGEIILGLWRVYSHLLVTEGEGQVVDWTVLPPVQRFILPFISSDAAWRDRAGVDAPIMRAAFPGVSIETGSYWRDLERLESTVVFERVILVNRAAAHKHPFGSVWHKMAAGAMNVTVPDDFWRPIRENVWNSLWGPAAVQATRQRPLVTYISRQGGGRRLIHEDHDALVESLHELELQGICDVQVVRMETLSLKEQIGLMRNTTILLGVHGNGLTHQLWMQPSPHSAVIEMLIPGGYVFDYEMLARNMGHRHYAVWNDTYVTYEKGVYHKGVNYPEDFHGEKIPVYGPAVADIIRARLRER
ncbi:hypothetical protein MKEN_00633200 [Mycena kentingensis (nom. inval.)]|nr:hypothetical protein MKEN_00633200 [Mycena kentingensis (nom. inval.)]